jgi:hypothetical protein
VGSTPGGSGVKKISSSAYTPKHKEKDPLLLGEQDGSYYYHINFHAQDKKGHAQLFFGEIRVCVVPKEEDATCCSPVSPSDAGMSFVTQLAHAFM